MRAFSSVIIALELALGLTLTSVLTGCGASTRVDLDEVDGSGVKASVDLHEALTKSFYFRVDAFVEVDDPTPQMQAAFVRGSCAEPGALLVQLQVHRRGEGGAAEIVLAEGRLSDLAGHSIIVFTGEPDASPTLACSDL